MRIWGGLAVALLLGPSVYGVPLHAQALSEQPVPEQLASEKSAANHNSSGEAVNSQPHDGSKALEAGATPAAAPVAGRPRIGLVLGGGGARGFAHIGVLQVLEENRIPVDVIAGTSMGAVVGSLYALGESGDDLKRIAGEISWDTIFNDNIPRDQLSFRRKQDERDVLIDYRISFDSKGLVLPKGVLRGQDLFLVLSQYLVHGRDVSDFDDLSIPFRAVASDIETGQAEIMGDGDIVTAVFASMAVPGGLPPVERQGKLLVDGYVANNLPIEVARSMGAERLIVVDVGTPLQKRDKLTSFVSVLTQMQTLVGYEAVTRQLATLSPADVLIRPEQPDTSPTAFEKSQDSILAGREAAQSMLDELGIYALSPEAWEAHLAQRQAKRVRQLPVVQTVRIENESEVPDSQIAALVTQQPNQPLDVAQLTKDLSNVYGLNGFRSVRYGFAPGQSGDRRDLIIRAEGDPTAANWLQIGMGIATDFNRQSRLDLGLAYTDRNFKNTGLEWRTDIRVGTDLLLESGFYAAFGNSNPIFGKNTSLLTEITPYWSRTDTVLYGADGAYSAVRDNRVGIRWDGGVLLSNQIEFRVGINYASIDLDTLIGVPAFDVAMANDLSWRAAMTIDTLDKVGLPTKGLLARVELEDHFGLDLDYTTLSGAFVKPFTWNRSTLVLAGEFGFTANGGNILLGNFKQGGFLRLSGLNPDQLLGAQTLLGRAVYYHRLSDPAPIIDLPLYVGGSLEVGNSWRQFSDIGFGSLRPAGSLFVGAQTPLGPLMLATGLARGGAAMYLVLGRIF